jgi:hypothetical protein
MESPLATYLADHLAGSVHAIELLKAIKAQHSADPLGEFAADILKEVESDRAVLQSLAKRVGSASSGVKEIASWISEKFSRLKLRQGSKYDLGTFEALEFLVLGINGKLLLWKVLLALTPDDSRLSDFDFKHLAQRAEIQRDQVEQRRLQIAPQALGATEAKSSRAAPGRTAI